MELGLVQRLFEDKQIMNPMNPQEVFTCKDLIEGNLDLVVLIRTLNRLQNLSQGETASNGKSWQKIELQ